MDAEMKSRAEAEQSHDKVSPREGRVPFGTTEHGWLRDSRTLRFSKSIVAIDVAGTSMFDATQILPVPGGFPAGEIARIKIERPNYNIGKSANAGAGSPPNTGFSSSGGVKANRCGPKRIDLPSETLSEVNLTAQQLRIMLDTIPTFAWSCFKDGSVEFLNKSWLVFTGLSQSEAAGWGWVRAVHPEDLESLTDTWRTILAAGEPGEAEARLRRFDGEYRWFLFRAVPFRDEAGAIVRWYGTNTDIEDLKRAEREIRGILEAQNAYLLDELRTEQNFGDIFGTSCGLRKVLRQIELVAPTDATVLITGESGTGKELVARAIHEHSARNGRALIKLNCSAVPEGLFESEFFGHVRGSFTGALKDKPGRFELADGGTLLLDEIGEVPLAMQAKLLRVLQEQELERIGDTRTRKVNVRVIAATNRDLTKEVDEGRFREDLFYRLRVFPIEVPPLRERRDDIASLAAHFIRQSARKMNRPEPSITQAALTQLTSYDWPGNVRQLQNVIERSIILWQGGPLIFDLPLARTNAHPCEIPRLPTKQTLITRDELKRRERDAIVATLKETNGKIFGPGGAAELLGMKPTTLSSRISALGLNRKTMNA
jgi:PAS domain S-box-containing protein